MPRIVTRSLREVAFFTAVAFFVILSAFPFYWMLITAFKPNSDLYNIANAGEKCHPTEVAGKSARHVRSPGDG